VRTVLLVNKHGPHSGPYKTNAQHESTNCEQ
jgi:hypothetical protein